MRGALFVFGRGLDELMSVLLGRVEGGSFSPPLSSSSSSSHSPSSPLILFVETQSLQPKGLVPTTTIRPTHPRARIDRDAQRERESTAHTHTSSFSPRTLFKHTNAGGQYAGVRGPARRRAHGHRGRGAPPRPRDRGCPQEGSVGLWRDGTERERQRGEESGLGRPPFWRPAHAPIGPQFSAADAPRRGSGSAR